MSTPRTDQRVLPVTYDRGLLVEAVMYHHKDNIKGCFCGWSELGACHAQHVADVYEKAARAQ